MLNYMLIIAVSLLGVALAGIIAERHFIAIFLAIELDIRG